MRYFIRDCNGKVVGNRAGYRTYRGAVQQQNMVGSTAYNAIWKAFWQRAVPDNNLICSIKLEAV